MAEHADQPLAVIDEHGFAVEEVIAHQNHLACGGRLDRRAGAGGKVEARVRVAFLAIKEATHAKGAGLAARHRAVKQQVAGLAWAELRVGVGLLFQLTLNARQLGRRRVDLALVAQGNVLLIVFARADGKA